MPCPFTPLHVWNYFLSGSPLSLLLSLILSLSWALLSFALRSSTLTLFPPYNIFFFLVVISFISVATLSISVLVSGPASSFLSFHNPPCQSIVTNACALLWKEIKLSFWKKLISFRTASIFSYSTRVLSLLTALNLKQ